MKVYLPIVVFVIGLLLWLFSPNAKWAEIGRAMFWTGLAVTIWAFAAKVIHL